MVKGFRHMSSTFDPERILDKLGTQPGPMLGAGRGPGRPWQGIVEETPQLWAQWFAHAAKRARRPLPGYLLVDGVTVRFTTVPLTFGDRTYFRCPQCGRRVEVVYVLPRQCACRRCCRLGYRSQAHRSTSAWGLLDMIFARDLSRWELPESAASAMVKELRGHLLGEIEAMLRRVTVPQEADED